MSQPNQTLEIQVEPRANLGTNAARRLRRLENRIPCVIYGGDAEPQGVSIHRFALDRLLENEAFYTTVLHMAVGQGGKAEQVVLKAIDHHPTSATPLHLDFQRVTERSVISSQVPIHFLNEESCAGVKRGGGVIAIQLADVRLRGAVSDLPQHLEVDMEDIEVGSSVRLSDLTMPKGVSIPALTRGQDQIIVSVVTPRGGALELEEEEAAAAAAKEAAEAEGEDGAEGKDAKDGDAKADDSGEASE